MASANSGDQPSITKGNLLHAANANAYDNIVNLFKIVFGDLKDDFKFTHNNSKKALGETEDPFFIIKSEEGKHNLDNIAEWYESKNPEYKPISEVSFNVPEFNFILAVMLKDLFILSKTTKYPIKDLENRTMPTEDDFEKTTFNLSSGSKITPKDFLDLFNEINSKLDVEKGILYKDFIDILSNYLSIFTLGVLYSKLDGITQTLFSGDANIFLKDLKLMKLGTTAYILYPSVVQLSYDKIIYTTQAPVINFRLTNKRRFSENQYLNPIREMFHDLNHSMLTHRYADNIYEFDPIVENVKSITGEELATLFRNIKQVIDLLKPIISYSSLTEDFESEDYCAKYLCAYVIFVIIHERYGSIYLFDLSTYLQKYKNLTDSFDGAIAKVVFKIFNISKDTNSELTTLELINQASNNTASNNSASNNFKNFKKSIQLSENYNVDILTKPSYLLIHIKELRQIKNCAKILQLIIIYLSKKFEKELSAIYKLNRTQSGLIEYNQRNMFQIKTSQNTEITPMVGGKKKLRTRKNRKNTRRVQRIRQTMRKH